MVLNTRLIVMSIDPPVAQLLFNYHLSIGVLSLFVHQIKPIFSKHTLDGNHFFKIHSTLVHHEEHCRLVIMKIQASVTFIQTLFLSLAFSLNRTTLGIFFFIYTLPFGLLRFNYFIKIAKNIFIYQQTLLYTTKFN